MTAGLQEGIVALLVALAACVVAWRWLPLRHGIRLLGARLAHVPMTTGLGARLQSLGDEGVRGGTGCGSGCSRCGGCSAPVPASVHTAERPVIVRRGPG